MKIQYLWLGGLTALVFAILVLGPQAYADDVSPLIQSIRAHRAQMEAQLGIDPKLDTYPRPTCYYDDLVDHYETVQLVRDDIDRGLPPGPWWSPSST